MYLSINVIVLTGIHKNKYAKIYVKVYLCAYSCHAYIYVYKSLCLRMAGNKSM